MDVDELIQFRVDDNLPDLPTQMLQFLSEPAEEIGAVQLYRTRLVATEKEKSSWRRSSWFSSNKQPPKDRLMQRKFRYSNLLILRSSLADIVHL